MNLFQKNSSVVGYKAGDRPHGLGATLDIWFPYAANCVDDMFCT